MNTRKIISASRRSDIPAFYSPWFKKRVEEGFCHVINPYNQKVFRVSFLPEDVLGFVFWTRNPAPLLKYLDLFDRLGFSYCFHFTITGYGAPLETSTPPLQTAIRLFKKLSRKVTPSRIFWRYDPIILSSLTPIEFHIENFGNIASQLSKYTGVSIISFIDFYKKTKKNLQDLEASNGLSLLDFSGAGKGELTRNLESIAAKNNMKLETCCEEDLDTLGFNKAACINRDIFSTPAIYRSN